MNEKVEKTLSILAKGTVGALPGIGPLLAEVIGEVIPDRRLERIENLLKELDKKISEESTSEETIKEKLASIEGVDLLEDCMFQAAKALTPERISYLASILKNGITKEDEQISTLKRILQIISELSDAEIIVLKAISLQVDPSYRQFYAKHESILARRIILRDSTEEEVKEAAILQNHRPHLRTLGLITSRYKVKKNELPEFDSKTGQIKANGDKITILGKILLESIDELN